MSGHGRGGGGSRGAGAGTTPLSPLALSLSLSPSSHSSSSSSLLSELPGGTSGHGARNRRKRMWTFLRRLVKVGQMDFEEALWNMLWLLVSPKRVYRNAGYHKQTKNQWARDDPAFLVILCFGLTISAIAYSIAFGGSFWMALRMIVSFVCLDFILSGLIIATLAWWFANRFLRVQSVHSVEQTVEWAYAFDIHCNSFIPIFFILFLLQFLFMPLLVKDNFFAVFLGNTLYFTAFVYYTVITFLGYSALPFLQRTEIFLTPIFFDLIFYIVSLFLVNISRVVLNFHFSL